MTNTAMRRRPVRRAFLGALAVLATSMLATAPASASPVSDILEGIDFGSSGSGFPTNPPGSTAGFSYPVTFTYTGSVPFTSAQFEFGYPGGNNSCVSLSSEGFFEQQDAFPTARTATFTFRKSGSCSTATGNFRLTLRSEGSRDRYTGNFQVVMFAPSSGNPTTTAWTRCTGEPDYMVPGYTGIRMGCTADGVRGADSATVVYS
jgi:hypothetical protein